MAIIFKPNGALNVSTAATDLPESGEGMSVFSDALQRCKNLSVDRMGFVQTRPGSVQVSGTALASVANLIIEQGGARYEFISGAIYRNEASLITGLSSGQWSGLVYNSYNDTTQNVFAMNGTDRKRIESSSVNEWGITAPSSAPTDAVGASTGLTGTYKAKVTYCRKSGSTVLSESNPSDASTGRTLANQSLSVTWSASSDPQVTHVRVYRTLANGATYYHDQDVTVGTVTVDTNTADSALGTEVATDHDRPPTGEVVAGPFYNGTVFVANGNLLYWSKPKQPEYFPANNYIEVGPPQYPILAMVSYDGNLYCITKIKIWLIQGTGTAFNAIPLESLTGCPNIYGALAIKGHGIYHIGADGIYLYAGGRDKKVTQDSFEPLFRGETTNGMQAVSDTTTQWLFQYENRIYFHYGNGNCLVFNTDNNRPTYYKWDLQISAPCYDKTNERFLACDALKIVRVMEDRDETQDDGSDIEWEIESKDFMLQTRAHFPRWIKYDVDASDASSVEGKIILQGETHQTHTITGERNTRYRLIETGNGKRCSLRITGTSTAKIYAAEME